MLAIQGEASQEALLFFSPFSLDRKNLDLHRGEFHRQPGGILVMAQRHLDLIPYRTKISASDIPDKLYLGALGVSLAGYLVIGGLDVRRFHWSGSVPLAVQITGLLGYVLGTSFHKSPFRIAAPSNWRQHLAHCLLGNT